MRTLDRAKPAHKKPWASLIAVAALVALAHPDQTGIDLLTGELRAWADAIGHLTPGTSMAARLEQLREHGLSGMGELQRDLAGDWGGVTQLSEEEAAAEVRGAIDRLASRSRAQAAAELVRSGLSDETARQQHRDWLASRKPN